MKNILNIVMYDENKKTKIKYTKGGDIPSYALLWHLRLISVGVFLPVPFHLKHCGRVD